MFTNTLSLLEFISLCKCVNVLLDPIHFGGGNSFLETMLVGTPSITMPGTHLKTNITAAANKHLYNNLKALKEFEQFLEEAHTTAQSGNKLKDGYKIRF